jgi:3-isopropylmalate/(R)-2-methylmalate dehydratase small subunit
MSRIHRIEGRGLPLRGHDVDTDRIIPARFLKAVRFDGLEAHVFEDERAMFAGPGRHPFDDPAFAGATVLAVNRNFGCGSSREHAPQALFRWGIRAVVGESFSEIFFGNSLALGLPCVSAHADSATALQARIESDPTAQVVVDLEALRVTVGRDEWRVTMPGAARDAFLSGAWDATGLLLESYADVEAVAARLPYVTGRW